MSEMKRMGLKQVIIVRKDLKLPKGKLCVQVAHASVSAMLETEKIRKDWVTEWLKQGQKKVVLKVDNLEELLKIKKILDENQIPNILIRDAGLTVLPPNTITCLGIGPVPEEIIDKFTGHLKLL